MGGEKGETARGAASEMPGSEGGLRKGVSVGGEVGGGGLGDPGEGFVRVVKTHGQLPEPDLQANERGGGTGDDAWCGVYGSRGASLGMEEPG